MPSRPAIRLIGSAITVTIVNRYRLRALSSLTRAAISSCSNLMRSWSAARSLSTTVNSSVAWRRSWRSSPSTQPGGRCSRRNRAAGSGASRRCRRTSTRRSEPRSSRWRVRRPASSRSSMVSTRATASRTMFTSTSAWSRSRWIRSSLDERSGAPWRTSWRRRSIEARGFLRALIATCGVTWTHKVEISALSSEKPCSTSLTTAIRALSASSRRVEREPWCRVS